jgi:hypothetical protein
MGKKISDPAAAKNLVADLDPGFVSLQVLNCCNKNREYQKL